MEAEAKHCCGANPGFPRNPSLAPLPLFSTVQYMPGRWLFDLYREDSGIEGTSQTELYSGNVY